jgi:integrase
MSWDLELRRRGLSPATAYHYARAIERAERFLHGRRRTLRDCTEEDLLALADATPRTHSTLTLLRAALRHAWIILGRTDPPFWPLRPPRRARMRSRALRDHQAATLHDAAWAAGYPRGTAALCALYAGLRRFEIAQLRLEHLDADGWITVIGKADVTARIPAHPRLAAHLRGLGTTGYVFPGRTRPHVCPNTVWHWIRFLAVDAGLPLTAPHVLRHTMITTVHELTGDMLLTQELARHADPKVTAGYVRITDTRMIDAIASLSYGAGL